MSIPDIIRRHADENGVKVRAVLGKGRQRELTRARQGIALELRGPANNCSLHEIARHLGGLNHTSVLYLLRRGPLSAAKRERKTDWRVGLGL